MSGNEISELASTLPAPAAGELPAERAQVLREHLLTEFLRTSLAPRAPGPRHRFRRPSRVQAVGAGLLAAAAAAGAFVLVSGTGAAPAGASPQAATLLAKIADAAQRQASPAVRDSEFMYIRSDVAFAVYTNGSQTPTMDKLHERQVWLPVANICATGLLIENGTRTPLSAYPVANGKVVPPPSGLAFAGCGRGSLNDPTYRLLQSLPTDPRTLLNEIYAGTAGEGQAQGPAGEAFTTIGDLIREAIVPPRTAAALYRAAALIPGVTFAGHVTNAVGRPGIAIAFTGSQGRSEWIFDPATLQFIGERDSDATGAVTGDSAILQQAFVAKAGQLPGR